MKTYFPKVLLFIIFISLFTSCKNDEIPNEPKSKFEQYSIFGDIHNQVLDEVITQVLENDVNNIETRSLEIKCINDILNNSANYFNTAYKNNEELKKTIKDQTVIDESAIIGTKIIFERTDKVSMRMIGSEYIKVSDKFNYFQERLTEIIKYYTEVEIDVESFNAAIKKLGLEIENSNLSEDEEDTLLIALNVGIGSYSYWLKTLKKWINLKKDYVLVRTSCTVNGPDQPSNNKQPAPCADVDGNGFDFGSVVGSDVGGAVGGGVAGAVVGSLAGGVGAAPGAVTGAISGGIANSVSEGVGQLINNWTNGSSNKNDR